MSNKILITLPNYEMVVEYLVSWNKELITLAESKSFDVKVLEGDKVTKKTFEGVIKSLKPDLVLLNGHGSEEIVAGHKNEPILIYNENDEIVKDSIVHALSCDSATTLGESVVEKGAKAYLGYASPFIFLTDKNSHCRPGEDRLANYFREPAIEAPKRLIKGDSVKEAFDKAKNKYQIALEKVSISSAPLEAEQIRFALFSNWFSLTIHTKNANHTINS